jgi:hypothetical protein
VNSPHRDDDKNPAPTTGGPDSPSSAAEDKRAAARRRFLKMGAGGSTAVVVTIMHRRAFAGIKKGQIISQCVSLQGVPDLKGMDQKKALQLSPMGTPKGVQCLPRPATNTCSPKKDANYYNEQGIRPVIASAKMISKGCGNLDDTIAYGNDFRLYEKGYCPVKWDGDLLTYDTSAVFYEKKGCTVGQPKDGGLCVDLGVRDKDGKVVTFVKHQCQ